MKVNHQEKNVMLQAIYRTVVKSLFKYSDDQRGYDVLDIVTAVACRNPDHLLEDLGVSLSDKCTMKKVGEVSQYLEAALAHGEAAIQEYLSMLQGVESLSTPVYNFGEEGLRLTDLGIVCAIDNPIVFQTVPEEAFSNFVKARDMELTERYELAIQEDLEAIQASKITVKVHSEVITKIKKTHVGWSLSTEGGETYSLTLEDFVKAEFYCRDFSLCVSLEYYDLHLS